MKTRFVIASFLAALPVSAADPQPFAPTQFQLEAPRSAPVTSQVGIEDAVYFWTVELRLKRGFRFRDVLANSQDKPTAEPLPLRLSVAPFILDSATPISPRRHVAPLPLIPRPAPSDTLQLPTFILEQPTPSLSTPPSEEQRSSTFFNGLLAILQ
jgi:hypothetical protein